MSQQEIDKFSWEVENKKIKEKENNEVEEFKLIIDKLYDINLDSKYVNRNYKEIKKKIEYILEKNVNSTSDIHKKLFYFLYLPPDNDKAVLEKPDWLDMEKFEKGQQFARDNLAAIFLGQFYGLMSLHCDRDGLQTLIMTQKSHTPYLAFKRYLDTAECLRNWFTGNPWCEDTKSHKDILKVRKMHLNVRRKLEETDKMKIREISTINNPYCPFFRPIVEDFSTKMPKDPITDYWYEKYRQSGDLPTTKRRSINQMDLSYTLFGFMGFIVLYPSYFGIHENVDENLENFCYLWRCLAYLLGVNDEINMCYGNLEEIRKRCQDYIDEMVKPALRRVNPEYEHMIRCIIQGHRYFLITPSFETMLLLFADLLDLEMPTFYSSLTFYQRITFYFTNISTSQDIMWTPWTVAVV
ncbi:PREDICTED: uncharacterized protein LOC107071834 isoform X2 [Polistes dominula]|uniref:Uncharacterized protein LOC107071834 isoform X2 n=1 Tax=Polistes dominula TaxID=743375 RepID=A0ABM1J2G1_POLDO|nr:PREDICTED: uncharacterized protein LOC107071834 isoform X2 [Polistes dominula]